VVNEFVESGLVVGGGIAGMSAAIEMRKLGIAVDLVDLDPNWRVYGAGITITSPTLRAFGELGVLEEVMSQGFSGNGIRICDMNGLAVDDVADPRGLPGSGGIMRPVLHKILADRTTQSGVAVRLGVTVDHLEQDDNGVRVAFSNGDVGRYDLVIGADGLYSKVRRLILPDAPAPEYAGQMVWRLFAPRPAAIDRRHFFLGGHVKLGLSPVSQDSLYMFLLETSPRRGILPDAELPGVLATLLEGYGGVVGELRSSLSASSRIVVRPLEAFLLPPPWHRGHTLLIGDAAHPTTPQLASGAGMAVEDAVVLGQELRRGGGAPEVLSRFMKRRAERCRLVVESSLEIGRLERTGAPPAAQTKVVADALAVLAEPI
jgi:2-polyprenyl-6-methoxyphenol hydroxylase-like FAD-dependent oxidoreductase